MAIKKVEQQNIENLPEESIMDEELAAKYLQRELSVLKYVLPSSLQNLNLSAQ